MDAVAATAANDAKKRVNELAVHGLGAKVENLWPVENKLRGASGKPITNQNERTYPFEWGCGYKCEWQPQR